MSPMTWRLDVPPAIHGLDMIIDVHKANCTDCHQDPATGDYSLKIGSSAEGKYVKGITPVVTNNCTTCHGAYFFNHINPTLKHNVANSVTMHAECQQCHPDPQVLLVDPVNNQIHDACLSCHNGDGTLRNIAAGHQGAGRR